MSQKRNYSYLDLFWTLKEEWRDQARNAFSCWTKLGLDGYVTITLSILDLGSACGIISDHTSSLLMSNWPRNWLLIKIWEIELQEIVIQSLKIAKEINECIDWGRDENEIDPENATSPEPNELPISDLTHSLYILPFTFMFISPNPHLRFCNLLFVIYIQLFISSIYIFCYLLSHHLISCNSQTKFYLAQLEHSSN